MHRGLATCCIGSLALMDEISYRPRGATDTSEHRGGSVIAAHVHADDQIVYVSSGVIAVTTSSGVWSATPDRAVLTPAQQKVSGCLPTMTAARQFRAIRSQLP